MFKIRPLFAPALNSDANIIDLLGGRGRGGSHFMVQHAIISIMNEKFYHAYFMRAIHKDIRGSLWKGFMFRFNELVEEKAINPNDWELSENTMSVKFLPNGNTINSKGFKTSSGGQTANLKSLEGATNIYIEEAEETTYDQHKKLMDSLRKGKMQMMRSWNVPSQNHYLVKNWYNLEPVNLIDGNGIALEGWSKLVSKNVPGHLMIFGTYLDNKKNIPESKQAEWEQYKFDDPEHYFSDICGYTSGGAQGVIFKFNKHWFLYKDLPDIDFHIVYGSDFGGGKSDPKRKISDSLEGFDEADGSSTSVLVKLYINKASMSVYVKLLVYKAYISPNDFNTLCKKYTVSPDPRDPRYSVKQMILADSARPDLIRGMINDGLNVVGAKTKDGGSNKIKTGIDILKKYKIYFHEDDEPAIIDAKNYKWEVTTGGAYAGMKTGNPLKLYENVWDAIRYGVVNFDLYNF